jgi:site-specific recombinase XerD
MCPLIKEALSVIGTLNRNSSRTGPLFLNSHSERLSGPRCRFEPALEAAGIKDFTWHCLRHTFACRLVMSGVDS